MSLVKTVGAILGLAILLLVFTSIFTVREGHEGLLLRLGKLARDSSTGEPKVFAPGLHFKVPFINQAKVFDTRLQTLDIQSSRIVTEEKKDVLVDYFVKWRIKDLPLYYTRTGGNVSQTQILLEQQLNDGLRAQFGQRNISEVVSGERTDIMAILQEQANRSAQPLGVEVVDVRIKRIDLPAEVSTAVFERMRTERQRIANQHRAEGKSAAEAIKANADAGVTVILAKARRAAQVIHGKVMRRQLAFMPKLIIKTLISLHSIAVSTLIRILLRVNKTYWY